MSAMHSPENPAQPLQIDATTVIAIACVIAGWFWLMSIVVQVGRLELGFHFYETWTVLSGPMLLVTRIGSGQSAKSIAFGVLCMAAALAPLAPYFWRARNSWLGSFAPLVLMGVCGAILYAKTVSGHFEVGAGAGTIGRDLVDLANEVANRVTGAVGKHVSIGSGAYLSLAASVFLAVKGWRRFQLRPAGRQEVAGGS